MPGGRLSGHVLTIGALQRLFHLTRMSHRCLSVAQLHWNIGATAFPDSHGPLVHVVQIQVCVLGNNNNNNNNNNNFC